MAYKSNFLNYPNLSIPETPELTEEERRRALAASADQPGGGFISAGNRQMLVTPTGTATNFPTDRDMGATFPPVQQAPLGATPAPGAIQKPLPPPWEPDALTTNTQMLEKARTATGTGIYDPLTLHSLASQAELGGKAGAEAQQKLFEAGVTAPTNILRGETAEMTRAKMQKEAMGGKYETAPDRRQSKIMAANQARALAIFTQQREQKYQDDVRKMAYDTAQAKLGYERLKEIELRGKIGLDAETLLDKQLARDIKEKTAEADISKAKSEAELKELELKRERETEELFNPDTAKANELIAAPDISKYKQTWDEGMRLASRYNIPAPVRNELHLGVLASSYDSPVELAKDVEGMKDFPEDTIGVRGGDVSKYIPDIKDALFNNLPPDQAVEQILKDSGKEPTDKGYPQLALNIAAGVWKEYRDAGEAARAEAQAKIRLSDAQNLQTASTQLTQQIPLWETPEGFNDVVASMQKRLDRLSLIGKKDVRAEQGMRSILGLGAPEQYREMTPSKIKNMIINHLVENAGNDSNFKSWLVDQSDNPNSPLSNLLTMGVAKAQEGMKEKQIEQLKIIDANEKKNLFTEFDDKGNAVPFGTAEEAEQYRRAPSWEKEAIAENAKARIRYRLGNEARRTHLENRLDQTTAKILADRKDDTLDDDEREMRLAIHQLVIDDINDEMERLDMSIEELMKPPVSPPPDEDDELAETQARQQQALRIGMQALQNPNLSPEARQVIQEKILAIQSQTTNVPVAPVETTPTPAKSPEISVPVTASVQEARRAELLATAPSFDESEILGFLDRKFSSLGEKSFDYVARRTGETAKTIGKIIKFPLTVAEVEFKLVSKIGRPAWTKLTIAIEDEMRKEWVEKQLAKEARE